jgi:hypothetical protein
LTTQITQYDLKKVASIARYVSIRMGHPGLHEDLAQEFLADVLSGRFCTNSNFCVIYRAMAHYYRLWEKPRTQAHTIDAYWKMCARKPSLPSDFFELKELWNSATEGEKQGIFALLINYGANKAPNGSIEDYHKAKREQAYLSNFRKKHGIYITNGNTKRTRRLRLKRNHMEDFE